MCGQVEVFDNHIFVATEATIPGVAKYRTSMKQVRQAVTTMFEAVTAPVRRIVLSAAMPDDEGTLDKRQRDRVLRDVGQLIESVFVAEGRFAFASDGVTARSPFAQLLNTFYVRVVMEAVYGARDWMYKKIPVDVFQFLSRAQPIDLGESQNPFLRRDGEDDEAFRKRLDDLRVFRPNPMAELDPARQWVPMHRWQDSNGYRLSDRIWNTSVETRRTIDRMISQAFEEGMSATELARILEASLIPGQEAIRTNKPYSSDASYSAMRLARTEIARAANHVAFMSAYTNPYVNQIDVARSANGDKSCKICPQHATIGIGGERIRPPYSIYSASIPPYHPHDMCHVRSVITDSPSTVTNRLRAVMEDERARLFPPSVNPAAADALTQTFLHQALNGLVAQFRGQFLLPGF